MILSLIAAIGRNNELGKKNALLFSLPADMKHFREITTGHVVIMGRKTYESIGNPLPNRRNIVVTRNTDYTQGGVEIVHSIDDALALVQDDPDWGKEVFVIGGGELYREAIEIADKLYITRVDAEDTEADTFFPEFGEDWTETSRELHEADEKNPHAYAFLTYEKAA